METLKIKRTGNQYWLGSQHLPVHDDEAVKAFFKERAVVTFVDELPASSPVTLVQTEVKQILSITKKDDGYFLGSQKIGESEDQVRKLFKQYEVNFAKPTPPPSKTFFINRDAAGTCQVYDYTKTRVKLPEASPEATIKYLRDINGSDTMIMDIVSGEPIE